MIVNALRMVATATKEIWWKIAIKKVGQAAVQTAATEGARRIVQKKNKSLKKKIKKLNKMRKKEVITQEEYQKLRKRTIDESSTAEL